MPALVLVTAPADAQPRLRGETLRRLEKGGYVLERQLEKVDWAKLFEEAQIPSLFTPQRIFEIDSGDSLGPLPENFQGSIESGDADVIFLIFSEKSLQKNLGAAYKLAEIVPYEAAPYWPDKRAAWLQKLAKEKGYTLEQTAAALLVDWIAEEEELRSELEKLEFAADKKRITVALVNELSADDLAKSMLNLLDAVAKADVSETLKSIAQLRRDSDVSPALAALYKRIRNACLCARLGKSVGGALKLTAFQTKTATAMANLYGADVLSACLGELIRLSLAERSGAGEGWDGLEKLLLAMMSRVSRR